MFVIIRVGFGIYGSESIIGVTEDIDTAEKYLENKGLVYHEEYDWCYPEDIDLLEDENADPDPLYSSSYYIVKETRLITVGDK